MKGSIWQGKNSRIAVFVVGVIFVIFFNSIEPNKRESVIAILIGVCLVGFVVGLLVNRSRTGFAMPGLDGAGLPRLQLWMAIALVGLLLLGVVQWSLHPFGEWFNNVFFLGLVLLGLATWWLKRKSLIR